MATVRYFTTEEARTAGYQRGKNVSSGQPWAKLGDAGIPVPEGDDARPAVENTTLFNGMMANAQATELDERSTPSFQNSIAARIDGAPNAAELWAAFEDGLVKGMQDDLQDRFEKRGKRGVEQ